jgi:hypothetical protein
MTLPNSDGDNGANTAPSEEILPKGAERRKHRRAAMKLPTRFMLDDGTEHHGSVIDVSLGGVSIASRVRPMSGAGIIAYVEELGRLEGSVVRSHGVGFSVALTLTPYKRDRLEEKLSWRLNHKTAEGSEARRHEREPISQATKIQLTDGRQIACRVMDLSLGGVSVETAEWPSIGEEVMIGRMRGLVVRHHEHGIGIQFTDIPPSRGSLAEQLVSAA